MYWELTTKFDGELWFFILGCVGSILNVGFALSIYFIKELHVHPFNLYMYLALFEALFMTIYNNSFIICDMKGPDILAYSIFGSDDCENKLRALNLMG